MDFEQLRTLRAQRAAAYAEVEALDARIAEMIRQAITDGHGPTEIAKELGITRARVYQIIGR
ncbi:helix-turn-helix domain-containing protein [Mycolicibacterium conceptionense]|uniref:helix-turn-helix domain-containing protein n=1 Tax=Mycolicibacterium conceptionense TaxID=451644 RepID=UPI0002E3D6C7|nr:helix-turn-helix domain-containing protein [Mycolicibacterium conceptionense]